MNKLQITTNRRNLDWPLHKEMDQATLIQMLGVTATGSNGEDLTSKVVVNMTQVDVDTVGHYPVMMSVMDSTGKSVQENATINVAKGVKLDDQKGASDMAKKNKNGKKNRKWIYILLAVIVLILTWWGITAHNRAQQEQADNNSEQSSQISNNSSSIDKLSSDNQKLATQVAELRGAVKQYQRDHDREALNRRLDQVSQSTSQLQTQTNNNTTRESTTQITNTIEKVRESPENGLSAVDSLKQESGFNKIWDSVSSQVSSIMSSFTN
ncbi:MAG: hypothetical protein Q3959_02475 [Limosilactobacillus sp.]|uniref:immunoglobulin-like domain-containing protein n=1 Tax=Limosilactobacillus sp. TaxID=2773925 RepID=UPI0026F4C5C9|nr:hypothetical protein [Limosilactobacillus sp.]